jgi:hypothetical protein
MEQYKLLIAAISNVLKARGFTKAGTTFYLFKENNWGVINFQKSKSATAQAASFTINLGVMSSAVNKADSYRPVQGKPQVYDCHMQKRIGDLLPARRDHWWQIEEGTSLPQLTAEIEGVLTTLAIPEIERYITDESLIQAWLAGVVTGISERDRYLHLTTLLQLHRDARLPAVMGEFTAYAKKRGDEERLTEHIRDLKKIAASQE